MCSRRGVVREPLLSVLSRVLPDCYDEKGLLQLLRLVYSLTLACNRRLTPLSECDLAGFTPKGARGAAWRRARSLSSPSHTRGSRQAHTAPKVSSRPALTHTRTSEHARARVAVPPRPFPTRSSGKVLLSSHALRGPRAHVQRHTDSRRNTGLTRAEPPLARSQSRALHTTPDSRSPAFPAFPASPAPFLEIEQHQPCPIRSPRSSSLEQVCPACRQLTRSTNMERMFSSLRKCVYRTVLDPYEC